MLNFAVERCNTKPTSHADEEQKHALQHTLNLKSPKYKDWSRLNQRRFHPSEPFLLVAAIQPVPVPSGPKTSTKPLRSSLLDISPSPDVWLTG